MRVGASIRTKLCQNVSQLIYFARLLDSLDFTEYHLISVLLAPNWPQFARMTLAAKRRNLRAH